MSLGLSVPNMLYRQNPGQGSQGPGSYKVKTPGATKALLISPSNLCPSVGIQVPSVWATVLGLGSLLDSVINLTGEMCIFNLE